MPQGMGLLRFLFLIGGLAAFAAGYIYFIANIWSADAGQAPNLNNQIVYLASAVGAVLGTFFAVALGIERKDPAKDPSKLALGNTLLGQTGPTGAMLATLAVWLYAAVGLAAGITVIFHASESPESVKALASAFGGYALAIFSGAFGQGTQPSTPVVGGDTRTREPVG